MVKEEIKVKMQNVQDTIDMVDDIEVLENYGIIQAVKVFDELDYNKNNQQNSLYILDLPEIGLEVFTYDKSYSYDGDIDAISLKSLHDRHCRFTKNERILKWLK